MTRREFLTLMGTVAAAAAMGVWVGAKAGLAAASPIGKRRVDEPVSTRRFRLHGSAPSGCAAASHLDQEPMAHSGLWENANA